MLLSKIERPGPQATSTASAAEARAKIVYERLINVTDDPGIQHGVDAHSILAQGMHVNKLERFDVRV